MSKDLIEELEKNTKLTKGTLNMHGSAVEITISMNRRILLNQQIIMKSLVAIIQKPA